MNKLSPTLLAAIVLGAAVIGGLIASSYSAHTGGQASAQSPYSGASTASSTTSPSDVSWATLGDTPTADQTQSKSTQPAGPSGVQTASISDQKQCAQDGAIWFKSWLSENYPATGGSYYDPEYHFSQKLNTCLAYVGVMQDTSIPATDFSQPPPPDTSWHYYYVYDIYANTPILQSLTYRTCSGPCTETLETSPDNSIPNVGTNDFFAQESTLMSQ